MAKQVMAPIIGPPYSQVNRPPAPKLVCAEPGKTRQSEKDACDINRLMARYEKTGVIPQRVQNALFADVSRMGDYRTAIEQVRLAEQAFMQLPANVRARFENDAAAFLDFASDPANAEELGELGLFAPEAPEEAPKPPEEEPPPEGEAAAS